jgi:hypothetical protein
VQEALDELRAALGSDRVPMGDVVIRGAREMAAELRDGAERKAMLRRRAADRIRTRRSLGIDREAAAEVRRTGWARQL